MIMTAEYHKKRNASFHSVSDSLCSSVKYILPVFLLNFFFSFVPRKIVDCFIDFLLLLMLLLLLILLLLLLLLVLLLLLLLLLLLQLFIFYVNKLLLYGFAMYYNTRKTSDYFLVHAGGLSCIVRVFFTCQIMEHYRLLVASPVLFVPCYLYLRHSFHIVWAWPHINSYVYFPSCFSFVIST